MLSPVSVDDWSTVDIWWGDFKDSRSQILAPSAISKMPGVATGQHWGSVDDLWNAFEADHETVFADSAVRGILDDTAADAWNGVDEFWDSYAAQQRADLRELQEVMAAVRAAWRNGASRFDDDPLTTNWRSESQYEGPLRTSVNEEDWSQWLAHLLRTSSGAFAHELLGVPNRPPTTVRREVVFFGDDTRRRVDILVEYEDRGVSIEVKRGDEHYWKTPETAGLVEQADVRDWSHVLLLQEKQRSRLQQTFGSDLKRTKNGSMRIRSGQSNDIDVRYWRDVSRVLRRILMAGREPDSHWEASAYLFITLIEQRILGLHSFSFVDPTTADGIESARTADIQRLVVADPIAQIEYLESVLQEDDNHE